MFSRTVIETMRKWADKPTRKPLVVRGARQVGKTTAVDLLGGEFDQYVSLNLERQADSMLFERGLSADDLFQAILLKEKVAGQQGRLLLFLDEIQACPKAIEYLRYFHEDLPRVHVIAAGSLLEIVLSREGVNFPVGRVEHCFMHPLSFREFLAATGDESALRAMDEVPLPSFAFPHLLDRFRRYALVGGMPEVVARYADTKDVPSLNPLYRSLLISFIDDARKYARSSRAEPILRHAIEAAPLEAGRRLTFAGFGQSNYGSREMGEALRTLERAMLIRLLPATTSTEIPIVPDIKKSPRLQFLDTGLVNSFLGLQSHFFAYDDLHSFHRGIIAEHIVGQELMAQLERPPERLCFWVREKRQASAEVDFVFQHEDCVVPVEVKSGRSGTLRSLHQFMNRCPHEFAIRLYSGPLKLQRAASATGGEFFLLNMPYFLASKLREYVDVLFHDRSKLP